MGALDLGPLRLLLPALLALAACDAFDSGLIDPPGSKSDDVVPPSAMDGGKPEPDAATDAGSDEDSGTVPDPNCEPSDEVCNGVDDDCDTAVDEDTLAECEGVILNADTGCFPIQDGAVCLLVRCEPGYANCDGDPTNGCEKPYCDCNFCDVDGGTDEDAGR